MASREDLEYDNSWNLGLQEHIRRLFSNAVTRLSRTPTALGLRYMWPKYLSHHRSSHDFWNQLHRDIVSDLSQYRILESCDPLDGSCYPSELRYLAPKYRFKGHALFSTAELRKVQLSFAYDRCIAELKTIGVHHTTLNDLMLEFSVWLAENGPAALSAQPPEWHHQVASIFCHKTDLKTQLEDMKIVPIRDGSWACANCGNVYLPCDTEQEYVPSGIDILIIQQSAADDPVRRQFFEFLGIKSYTPQKVCSLILKLHSGQALHAMHNRAPEDLILDAAYLFKHQSQVLPQGPSDIYFLVNKEGVPSRRKSQVYILDDTAESRLVAKYKNAPGNPFYLLDARYETWICSEEEATGIAFRTWLLGSDAVSRVPKLFRNANLSAEWCFLRDTNVLDLLRAIKHHIVTGNCNKLISMEATRLLVVCQDGVRRPLRESAVPTGILVQTCPHIAYIDVPEPENWIFLEHFGVPIKPDTMATLRELVALTTLPIDDVDVDAVHASYRRLNCSWGMDRDRIVYVLCTKRRPLNFGTNEAR